MKRLLSILGTVAVVVIAVILIISDTHHPATPTYGGGVAPGTSTVVPTTIAPPPPTTPSPTFSTGPSGADGISVKGSVVWTAAQWVTNYYSEFYKWPSILYGPDVLARPFETPQFAAYDHAHNGNANSVGAKNAWTLLTVDKDGVYPSITSASVPVGVGTCALHCAVAVTWVNGTINSAGVDQPPPSSASSSSATILLVKEHGTWLVDAEPEPLAN